MSAGPKVGRTLLGITTVYPGARDIPFTIEHLAAELQKRGEESQPPDMMLLNAALILQRLADSPKARRVLFGHVRPRTRDRNVPRHDIVLDVVVTKRRYKLEKQRAYAKRALLDVAEAWGMKWKTVEGYEKSLRTYAENEMRARLRLSLDKSLAGDAAISAEIDILRRLSQELQEGKRKTP